VPAQNAQPGTDDRGQPLAPFWHTASLIALIVAVALTGTLLRIPAASATVPSGASSRITAVYFPTILAQIGLALYVCRVGRARNMLVPLLGRGWNGAHRAFADVALALLAGVVIVGSAMIAAHVFGAQRAASATVFLPTAPAERFVWVFVAATVGFCEEVVYRGYLQTQLAAFTHSSGLAIVCQALLFGIAHGDQGASGMAMMAYYGLVLGGLARTRSSLVPGILAHIGVDLSAGLWRS
jgi:uncharacterized protein